MAYKIEQIYTKSSMSSSSDVSQTHSVTLMRALASVFEDHHKGLVHQVERVLALGLERFDLDLGILAHIERDCYTVYHVCKRVDLPVAVGDVYDLGQTYCRETIATGDIIAIEHASQSGWAAHPAYQAFQLQSYIGIPVRVSGRVWGTLNFSSATPRQRHFSALDLAALGLMASWIGGELHRKQIIDGHNTIEQTLRQHQERLQLAAESADVGFWDWNLKTDETVFSDQWYRMLGYKPRELPMNFESWAKVCHPEDLPRANASIKDHVDGKIDEYRVEVRLQKKTGEWLWVQGVGRLVERDRQGDPVRMTGVHFNIDALKAAEQRRMHAQQEVDRRNRELETLVTVISHDLQEPIRMIDSFSAMLESDCGDQLDDTAQEYLQHVRRGGTRLARMIREIRILADAQRAQRPASAVPVHEVAQEVIEALKPQINAVGATVTLHSPLPVVRVEPFWIMTVLTNLVANALKFRIPNHPPEVEIAAFAPHTNRHRAGTVGISVCDRGPGIEPQFRTRIFGLFQRAVGQNIAGTGAGLAIVAQIAERHGGEAWMEPRLGGGAEFIVTFDG